MYKISGFADIIVNLDNNTPIWLDLLGPDLLGPLILHHQGSPEENKPNGLKSEIRSMRLDEQVLHLLAAVIYVY